MKKHSSPLSPRPSHIYWFAYYNLDSPSTRYRGKYLLESLQARRGISYSFVVPSYRPDHVLRFVWVFLWALCFRKKDSVIVFQKVHTRRFYGTALRLLLFFQRKNTLYDIDDADYLRFPKGATRHFIKNCSSVIAGSQALADYCGQLNPRVWQTTSAIIPHSQQKRSTPRQPGDRLSLVWIGFYNSHQDNLKQLLFPALERLDFPVKLLLLGVNRPHQFAELQEQFHNNPMVEVEMPQDLDWHNEASIYARIAQADLGLAPLLDTEINRSKSAFKLKQYLSCGLPVLGSPVGENQTFLQEGQNGLFCEDDADFERGIRHFARMSSREYRSFRDRALASSECFLLDPVADHFFRNLCDSLKQGEEIVPEVETSS